MKLAAQLTIVLTMAALGMVAPGARGAEAGGKEAADRAAERVPAENGADDSFDGHVAAAWQALAKRDVEQAKSEIANAAKGAKGADQKAELGQLKLLALCIERFWQAVDAELKRLVAGDELDLSGTRVSVVESSPKGLTLHVEGKNQKKSRDALPGRWALAVAEHRFDNSPANKLLLGAFLAVDPQGDRNRARQVWQKAQSKDPHAGELLTLLASANIPPAPAGSGQRGGEMPAEKPAKGTGGKVAGAADEPAPPNEPAEIPNKEKLSIAARRLKEKYAAELRAAKTPESKLALSKTLLRKSMAGDDEVLRLSLMRQALDLAAAAGNTGAIDEIVETIGKWFKIDAWEVSAEAYTRAAVLAKPDLAGEIIRRAVALLAQWEAEDPAANKAHAKVASKLDQAALAAAHRVGDPDLIASVAERKKGPSSDAKE
jgi:hypothetical protein